MRQLSTIFLLMLALVAQGLPASAAAGMSPVEHAACTMPCCASIQHADVETNAHATDADMPASCGCAPAGQSPAPARPLPPPPSSSSRDLVPQAALAALDLPFPLTPPLLEAAQGSPPTGPREWCSQPHVRLTVLYCAFLI